jgi:hypothetical protein
LLVLLRVLSGFAKFHTVLCGENVFNVYREKTQQKNCRHF